MKQAPLERGIRYLSVTCRQNRRTSYRFCVISGLQKWRHKFI